MLTAVLARRQVTAVYTAWFGPAFRYSLEVPATRRLCRLQPIRYDPYATMAFLQIRFRAMTTDLRYPIGRFEYPDRVQHDEIVRAVSRIEQLPVEMRRAIDGLTPEQLDTPYRPGGWTVRQVAHHVPDSHLNAYVRTKLALTEEDPVIRPYDEQRWAELADTAEAPVGTSIVLLEALHERWTILLRSCTSADFERPLRHPEIGALSLGALIVQYGWHGDHHVAHITRLREREGW